MEGMGLIPGVSQPYVRAKLRFILHKARYIIHFKQFNSKKKGNTPPSIIPF